MKRPTLYLGNRRHDWARRALHIQALPAPWMRKATVGSVSVLAPPPTLHALLRALVEQKKAEHQMDERMRSDYRDGYEAWMQKAFETGVLEPLRDADTTQGRYLGAELWEGGSGWPVEDGDALLCTCSRKEALAGNCHRALAAPWLERAGWRVVLD